MRTPIVIVLLLASMATGYCQVNIFRGKLFITDGTVGYDPPVPIYFPLSGDTLYTDSSGAVAVDISRRKRRIFIIGERSGNSDYMKSRVSRFKNSKAPDTIHNILMPDTAYYYAYQQKKICPACLKSTSVKPIVYVHPVNAKKDKRKVNREDIRGIGCVVQLYLSRFFCRRDKFSF